MGVGFARFAGAVCCTVLALAPSAFAANRGSRAAGLTYSVEYSGTYTDHTADSGGYHVWDTVLRWDEVLRASVSASGKVKAQPVKLVLSGTQTTENNLSTGVTSTITCNLIPGARIKFGGFINVLPRATPKPNFPLGSYSRFEAVADMPLGTAGEVAYGPGSAPSCTSPADLSPMLARVGASLPATWDAIAASRATGRPSSPIRKNLRTSFNLSAGGEAETVQASAVLTASVNRPGCATGGARPVTGPCYVGLGDSYSSGQVEPFVSGGGPPCFRSVYGYPYLYDDQVDFEACSGATIETVRKTQLSPLSKATKLVTITVGGNDTDLFLELGLCFLRKFEFVKCQKELPEWNDAALQRRLADLYETVHERAPRARLFVFEYPNPFPTTVPSACPELALPPLWTSFAKDVVFLHGLIQRLNKDVASAVRESRVADLISTSAAFAGRDVCSPAGAFWPLVNDPMQLTLHPSRAGEGLMAQLLRRAAGRPPD